MTVCIAALYDSGKGVVLASDRMVTAHFPIGYEFEHQETTKVVPMDEPVSIYALSAGDVLLGNEILTIAREQAQQLGVSTASGIAELVRSAYQSVRLTTIVRTELEPRGLDLGSYYNNHQGLLPQVVQVVDQAMSQSDIGVQFIIAGPSDSLYTIHTVVNPGTLSHNNPIGYSAVGSGAPHALYSLIEASYRPSLNKDSVREMVEHAKKRSEVAPGVGSGTQMVVAPTEGEENA